MKSEVATGADVEPLRTSPFEVGDLVFAKLKGYPPWPSKINQIETIVSGGKERVRYNVFFYGTHQSSILRSSSLTRYEQSAKSIVDKWGRKPKFHEALEELERELMTKMQYMKALRSTPDSSSNFTSACDGLLNDIQDSHNVTVSDAHRHSKSKDQGSKTIVTKKKDVSDSENEEDEGSWEEGYKVLYTESIPFPNTSECFIILSLGFDKDWVRKEAQKILEEERMMNCHVRIDPFPEKYKHLIPERIGSTQSDCSSPPSSPTSWVKY